LDLNAQLRRNVRTFYAWIGSMVLLGLSPIMAGGLIDQGTTLWRAAGAAVGVAGTLPWLWIVSVIIRRGDEFTRRIHLVAIAVAAVSGLVLLITLNWLVRAAFINPPDLMLLWVALLVFWVIALIGTKRYYERPR